MISVKEIAEREILEENRRKAVDALKIKIRGQNSFMVWLKSLLPFTITWKKTK